MTVNKNAYERLANAATTSVRIGNALTIIMALAIAAGLTAAVIARLTNWYAP